MSDVADSKPLPSSLTQSFMNDFNADIVSRTKSDKNVLLVADDPPPAMNSINFINLDECNQLAGSRNTKRVTASSVKLFRAFLKETNNGRTDFENFDEEILINHLITFFKRVRKPDGDLYTKNGLLSIRFGLRRRLLDLRKVDITKHPHLNSVFTAQINKLKREGKGDINHYPPISHDDMFKIYSSGILSPDTPKGLLRKIFFETEMFFCRRSRENLRDLKGSHFKIETDDQGKKYLTTDFDPSFGGGPIKRIYETGTDICPVKAFRKFLLKRHSSCEALFQRPVDIIPFSEQDPWFHCSALGLNKLANMMREISSEACLSKIYTNHSIRATSKSVFDLVWNGLFSQNSANPIAPASSEISNISDTTSVSREKPGQQRSSSSQGNETDIDLKSNLDIQEIERKHAPVEENNCELYPGVNNVGNTYSLNSFNGNVQAEKQAAEKDIVETAAVNPMEFKLRQSEFMEAQKQQAEFIEAQKQQAEFMEAQKQQAEFMEAQKQQAEKLAEERQQRQNENKVYKYMVLNHEKKILETLRTLWKGNQFCDAMLQNECVSIPVHKILLIACCPKILDTYDYIMKDTNVQVCFPRKVSADALRAFVDYLYNGSLNLSKSILDSMEYLSGMLGLDDIRQLCNQFRLDLFNDSNNVPDKTIVTVSHSQNTSGLHLSLSNPPATPPPPIIRLSSQTTLSAMSTTNIQMPSSSPHYQDNRRVSYSQKSSENRFNILPEHCTDSEVLNVNSIKLEPEVDLTVDDCTEVKQEIATYQNSEDCQFGSWSQIDSQSDDSLSHRKKNDSVNFDIQTTVDLSVTPLKSFTSHSQKTASHDDPDLQSVITISPSNSPLHSPTSVDSSPDVQTFEVDSETPNLKTHLNPYPVGLVMANTHNLTLTENNRKKRSTFEDFDVDFECKKSKMALQ
ncbi:XP_029646296.1uncharacterized protein LOC115220336 isoform X1 [Octopus vulgaris]|uniref:XP_029646296.1uncharacterized protein LOC115220336 isoform X1 n=1 Tax=Octopus vulgaris TaxID=6645 RepID=A0AA36BIU1_OCTVU|nr:XP_029646296.1uncharacterized protein LOC115220336 isoform X1 [Octopus vulgaris]